MERKVSMQGKILVDADALVSLVVERDSGHEWAVDSVKMLQGSESALYLTSYAYGEALTVVSMKVGLEEAVSLSEVIGGREEYVVLDVEREMRERGLEWFKKQTSKNSRFTDCVNMAVMEDLGIERVFSRDIHYKKNGFVRLGIDE